MKKNNFTKYRSYPPVALPNRHWPSRTIAQAPVWCSVDLRDGNQALPVPMNIDEKVEMFKLLVEMGFKQIEVSFPSASETEFRFTRALIEGRLIPEDVAVQVLTQSRCHLIERTFEALQGAPRAIIHLYNSTSELQRRVVFNKDRQGIVAIAVEGAQAIRDLAAKHPETEVTLQYSPESFTGTELDFALEICEAVINVWQPTPQRKLIINLPSTVEMATCNVYADQIEWFLQHVSHRESLVLSVHAHNDRGTSVAATELAMLAGAERVEGTLFGNGERTGNADLVNLAMNLYSQGIDPRLNFSDINRIVSVYEKCTKMSVAKRSPYAGELVYTAFSGSHQDAIRKGLLAMAQHKPAYWEVPYLPVDPTDVGREYESVIRINSQSGKGGAAFILENFYGFKLPKAMHPEFGKIVQAETDRTGNELSSENVFQLFENEYVRLEAPIKLLKFDMEEKAELSKKENNQVSISAVLAVNGKEESIQGKGNGPIDAFFQGVHALGIKGFKFLSYDEHSLQEGSDSSAVAYIQLENANGCQAFGVGIAPNISIASIKSLINAINRLSR
jgi:2-isopropylmalate synthase